MSKHSSPYALLRSGLAALLLAGSFAAALIASPAKADPVASDGSVGVNTQWEDGDSSTWYIELQRQGEYDVTGGIQTENDSEIRAGLLQFDWGFKQQASDGSFPGTAGGETGQMFHSTSLFIEAVARCTLLLKNYNPTTYTKNASYYNGKISTYTTDCEKSCQWLTEPSVQSAGQAYNQPFTHRRYLLAACLAQTAALSGDTTLNPIALSYAQDGISLQLPTGWRAAIAAPNSSGVYPPATLVAPGAAVPAGTKVKLSAVGVDPEQNGYDSGYQCLGLFYAQCYLPYCTDSPTKTKLIAAITAGLAWEQWFINDVGVISIEGDSRMGIEVDRDGNVKVPTIPDCWEAYDLGAQNTGDAVDTVFADRLQYLSTPVDTNTVYSDGAVDTNEAYSKGTSTSWSISNQKIAIDYIDRGVETENDALIQTGISVINWGYKQQISGGSFGTTSSPFYGDAAFVEAATRAAEELKSYKPYTYTPTTNYATYASGVLTDGDNACKWLTLPATTTHYNPTIDTSTAREWTQAACLAETGLYASDSAVRADADAYALNAIALQLSSGEDPEAGDADETYQALGLYEAEHYLAASDNSTDVTNTETAVNKGLIWEGAYVTTTGTVKGDGSAPILTLQNEYSEAVTDNLADSEYFQMIRYRLGGIPVE